MNQQKKSALHVKKGIDPPSKVNEEAIRKLKSKKSASLTLEEYVAGILAGNRTILSQAITLVESSLPQHKKLAQEIIAECLRHEAQGTRHEGVSSNQQRATGIRVGITGIPGVGKSTFIEALGKHITSFGHKLAVLAIDPSSTLSKGSILGDKTRMEELSVDPNAFIRPSPSAGSLGGVARKTRETIFLCEAAGYDVIFVETVGVGQSETAVKSMVDFFLLLMLPGSGDELQGIKRGIIEMADAIIINKADGDNLRKAKIAAFDFTSALHLFPPAFNGWMPVVDLCSAKTKQGIPEVWKIIQTFRHTMTQHGHFQRNRMEQNSRVLHEAVAEALREKFTRDPGIQKKIRKLEEQVASGTLNPYQAVSKLFYP
ncbi:MAG: methylmalonyl Co-A mutase-associated GTPase MeaB [bacterium]